MSQDTSVLAQNILQIIPQIMRILTAEFRRSGHLMTPGNFQMMVLLHYGPANLSDLAEYQNVSLPTISRSVSRLEKMGWIRRLAKPNDRRVTLIELTSDGRHQLEEMSRLAEATLGALLDPLLEADRMTLAGGLDVMRRTFDLYEPEKEE
ncbi:MAG TPA: MarR family transcriptional regulator [Anaerolineae bacterium]|nr:MarR family transcriptional regulator [Anaerolineae bacterium]